MNAEIFEIKINNALDLLQVITEDIEDNLLDDSVANIIKARAGIVLSSLYVLDEYLRGICRKVVTENG